MTPPELSQKEAEFFAKSRKSHSMAKAPTEDPSTLFERSYSEKYGIYTAEKAVKGGENRPAAQGEILEMTEKRTEPFGQDKSMDENRTAKASFTKGHVAKKEEQPGKEAALDNSKDRRPRTPERGQQKLKFLSPVTQANMRAIDYSSKPGHEPASW